MQRRRAHDHVPPGARCRAQGGAPGPRHAKTSRTRQQRPAWHSAPCRRRCPWSPTCTDVEDASMSRAALGARPKAVRPVVELFGDRSHRPRSGTERRAGRALASASSTSRTAFGRSLLSGPTWLRGELANQFSRSDTRANPAVKKRDPARKKCKHLENRFSKIINDAKDRPIHFSTGQSTQRPGPNHFLH